MLTRRFLVLPLLLVLPVLAVACGDDDDDDPTPTETLAGETPTAVATDPADTPTGAAEPSPEPEPTDEPFEGAVEPVSKPSGSLPLGTVVDVRFGLHPGFDRAVWEFDGDDVPGFDISYAGPGDLFHCGSGNPIEVEGGAFLHVRIVPSQAHNEMGELTIDMTEVADPTGGVILEAEQVCDFEGNVEWVIGLEEELPFAVGELGEPARLVVDIGHAPLP